MKKQLLLISLTILFSLHAKAQIINTVVGGGNCGSNYCGDGGQALNAALNMPTGLAINAAGVLFIVDWSNNVIRKVDANNVISTFAGTGAPSYSGDGGAATAATLNGPFAIALDAAGNVYIADQENNRIRKVTANGIINTVAGNGTAGYTGDGGAATAASFNQPDGIVIDALGNMLICDSYNSCIRKVTTGGTIQTIVGTGTAGYSGDGGNASSTMLNEPASITLDAQGNLFIADYLNNRIRKVTTGGIITTVAGDGTTGYTGDGGAASAAVLNQPAGVAFDNAGNLYIVDGYNYVVRKVNTNGIITTFAGNGNLGYTGDGGLAINAELDYPEKVTADAAGNLYISDLLNNVIRKVSTGNIGIKELKNNLNLTAYPNPATNNLQITSNNNEPLPLHIIDIIGNELMQATLQNGKTTLDISALPSGVYFLKTAQGTQKFIKQ